MKPNIASLGRFSILIGAAAIVAFLGFVVGRNTLTGSHFLDLQASTGTLSASDLETVVSYCRSLDASRWNLSTLHKSDEFLIVRQNLSEFLRLCRSSESPSLLMMVWRVAFLFGDEGQILEAGEHCWSGAHPLGMTVIPMDIARDQGLAFYMLAGGGARPEFVENMVPALAERHPARWGIVDYTPLLQNLMEEHGSPNIRIKAAYCLARWLGEGKVGVEAQSVLRTLAQTEPLARSYLNRLKALGTHGWDTSVPTSNSAEP